ncbi:MAG: hypothetical protein K8953_00115 [Proteobacteria bacterium]|nr:hypothetical protein [Pseudomonadota bacterium]
MTRARPLNAPVVLFGCGITEIFGDKPAVEVTSQTPARPLSAGGVGGREARTQGLAPK